MPFTPFHFGPGLLVKGVAPARVSFLAFATTQVGIDLESWYYLTAGDPHPHRILHTFAVGTIAGAAIGTGVWGVARLVRLLIGDRARGTDIGARRPILVSEVSFSAATLGGIIGGFTHALFDGLVHRDIQPLMPFSTTNPLAGIVGWSTVELFCVVCGFVGFFLAIGRLRFWKPEGELAVDAPSNSERRDG